MSDVALFRSSTRATSPLRTKPERLLVPHSGNPKWLSRYPKQLPSLPCDVLLNIAQFLELKDLVHFQETCWLIRNLAFSRRIWRRLAVILLDLCHPLPLDGFQRVWELDSKALCNVVCHGNRLKRGWSTRRPKLVQQPRAIPVNQDIVWLSPITSKYTLCCTKTGKVMCWDVRGGVCIAQWDAGQDWEIWKCRVEFDERIVYFAMARRMSRNDAHDRPQTECQLMALKFPEPLDSQNGKLPAFETLSTFFLPGPVISVYLLDPLRHLLSAYIWLEANDTLGLFVLLDWDVPRYAFVDTGLSCSEPQMQDWSCISYDNNIVIHIEQPDLSKQCFYSISALDDMSFTMAFDKAVAPVSVPPREIISYPFVHNMEIHEDYWSINSNFVRQWWPSLPTPDIRRCSCTVMLYAHFDEATSNRVVTLAQHYFSVPLRTEQLRRWYTPTPFEIVGGSRRRPDDSGAEQSMHQPLITVDFGHAVWIEYTQVGGSEKRLRFVTFPSVEESRMDDKFTSRASDGDIYTLDVPPEVNLDAVRHIGIDQAQGSVVLGMQNGQVFIVMYE